MWVSMGFAGWVVWAMLVLMVIVVDMAVVVGHRLMVVSVLVTFGQMQPDTNTHECGCQKEGDREAVTE